MAFIFKDPSPITPNMEENICFHYGSPPILPYGLLKHGKEHIGVINLGFKLDSTEHCMMSCEDNSEKSSTIGLQPRLAWI